MEGPFRSRRASHSGPEPLSEYPAEVSEERAPLWAQRYVLVFLTLFLACGLLGIDGAFPLTGWRLFSGQRHRYAVTWRVVTVDPRGGEAPIPFGALPQAYRHIVLIMQKFRRYPRHKKETTCSAWAAAVRARGQQVAAVRIYRLRTDLALHRWRRNRPPPTVRKLAYICADGRGVRAVA